MKIVAQISIGVLLLICCFFLFRGCHQGDSLQVIQDSLNREKALNDTIIIQSKSLLSKYQVEEIRDSIDRLDYQRIIDSQKLVIKGLQGKFKVTKDSIFALYGQLKTFYDAHDTVALLNSYVELRQQLTLANNQLFAIQISRDSADYTRDAEITRLNALVITLQSHIQAYEVLLTECTSNSSNLAKNGNLLAKKAKGGKLFAEIAAGILAIIALISLSK